MFLFTGVGTTTLLSGQLRAEHHWDVWTGGYRDVLPFVREAMDAVLDEFADTVEPEIRDEFVTVIRYLTDPEPTHRGYPRNLS